MCDQIENYKIGSANANGFTGVKLPDHYNAAVIGPHGVGKTALLNALLKALKHANSITQFTACGSGVDHSTYYANRYKLFSKLCMYDTPGLPDGRIDTVKMQNIMKEFLEFFTGKKPTAVFEFVKSIMGESQHQHLSRPPPTVQMPDQIHVVCLVLSATMNESGTFLKSDERPTLLAVRDELRAHNFLGNMLLVFTNMDRITNQEYFDTLYNRIRDDFALSESRIVKIANNTKDGEPNVEANKAAMEIMFKIMNMGDVELASFANFTDKAKPVESCQIQ